jgi:hypothetical protein
MAMRKRNRNPTPLTEIILQKRDDIVALSKLQKELREAVSRRFHSESITLNMLANRLGVPRNALNYFLNENRSISSGNTITALCSYAGMESVEQRIREAIGKFNTDKIRGLIRFDLGILEIVFAICEDSVRNAQGMKVNVYANAYGEYAPLVVGIMHGSHEAIGKLADPEISSKIEDLLTSNKMSERVQTSKRENETELVKLGEDLLQVLKPLRPKFPTLTSIERAAGIASGTLHYLTHKPKISTVSTLKEAIGKVRTLAARGTAAAASWQHVGPSHPTENAPGTPSRYGEAIAKLNGELVDAIEAVWHLYPSMTKIAKKAGVPRSTLRNAVNDPSASSEEKIGEIIGRVRALANRGETATNVKQSSRSALSAKGASVPSGADDKSKALKAEILEAIAAVRHLYPTKKAVAIAAGVPRSTLCDALYTSDRMSLGGMEKILGKIRALQTSEPSAAESESARSEPQQSDMPAPNGADDPGNSDVAMIGPPLDLPAHGGHTSPLGVRYVLGPQSFKDLDFDPDGSFIALAVRQLEITRILLNVSSQIRDNRARERVRKALGREVEELHQSIQMFSVEYPNRLTPLYEEQRQMWHKNAQAGASAKPISGKKGSR